MARITDRDFVERAVVAGHISEAQGEECLDLVRRSKDSGTEIRVEEVLVDRGYLTESQARSVRYGGKVITLQCTACGNECRVRGRRTKASRQCPKCGGRLAEEGDEFEQEGADAEEAAEDEAPSPDDDEEEGEEEAEEEGAEDEGDDEDWEDGEDEVDYDEEEDEEDEYGYEYEEEDEGEEEPSSRVVGALSSLLDRCPDFFFSRWFLTLVLTIVGTAILRRVLWAIGVR